MHANPIRFKNGEQIDVAVLRSNVALWKADHPLRGVSSPDHPSAQRHAALTAGRLRADGGKDLMDIMRRRLSKTGGRDLVIAWLSGVQLDTRYNAQSLEEVADMVLGGEIRLRDFFPLPLVS